MTCCVLYATLRLNYMEGGENLFYPNIAAERAKRRMSLDSLATQLGVTRKTLYNWENSGFIPQKSLEKMAELFNCSTDYLMETNKAERK